MRAQARPVEPPAGGHEHEQVVVVTAPDDDRPQQRAERDALQLGALLGAAGSPGADDTVGRAGGCERVESRRGLVGRHGGNCTGASARRRGEQSVGDHVESPLDDPVALPRIDRAPAEQHGRPVHGDPSVFLDAGPGHREQAGAVELVQRPGKDVVRRRIVRHVEIRRAGSERDREQPWFVQGEPDVLAAAGAEALGRD